MLLKDDDYDKLAFKLTPIVTFMLQGMCQVEGILILQITCINWYFVAFKLIVHETNEIT